MRQMDSDEQLEDSRAPPQPVLLTYTKMGKGHVGWRSGTRKAPRHTQLGSQGHRSQSVSAAKVGVGRKQLTPPTKIPDLT